MNSSLIYSLQTEYAIGIFLFVVIENLGFYLYKWLEMKNQRRILKKKKKPQQTTSLLLKIKWRKDGMWLPTYGTNISIPRQIKGPSR